VVMGTTMTNPTGQVLKLSADTTRTGRVPPCSPGWTGSSAASQSSPRSGVDPLNRALFPG
jgi:hypothetical protein